MFMTPRFAVMGNPIAHSLSPTIHQLFAKQTGLALTYDKIKIDVQRFESQVKEFFMLGGKGLNITLPCKERAFAMSQDRSIEATEAAAANTLWMHEGRLQADNTDGIGFIRDVSRFLSLEGRSILLLGAGGAAHGVLGPLLRENPLMLVIVNRTLERAHELQLKFPKTVAISFDELPKVIANTEPGFDVVINATSAGLQGQALLLPNALMARKPFCYDLAYNRHEATTFVTQVRAQGCEATDGLGMLVEQAAEAFYIWFGIRPDAAKVLATLKKM